MAHISADVEEYVQRKLASGEFSSREELSEAALRVYRELEERYSQLRADVQDRIKEAERGEVAPLDMDAIKTGLRLA